MAELTNVLRMTFRLTDDTSKTINVADCKTDLNEAVIKGAMNVIIAENIFSYDGVDLANPAGAKIVKTDTTEVF